MAMQSLTYVLDDHSLQLEVAVSTRRVTGTVALHLQTHGQLEWQAASGTVTVQRLLLGVSESDRDSDSESGCQCLRVRLGVCQPGQCTGSSSTSNFKVKR